jgi:hypothetical protein
MHRHMLTTGLLALAVSLGIAGSASISKAASYGNYSDPAGTVSFLNVADVNGLYGAPTVSGNGLDFSPATFLASCPGVVGGCAPLTPPGYASDTLVLEIQAQPGQIIDTVLMTEAGDTTLAAFAGAIAATTVVANVFIDVLEVNGIPVLTPMNHNDQMVFTRNGQFLTTDLEGPGTFAWSGLLSFNVNDVITADGGTGYATLVRISLSNTLTATANSGASARIQKKDVDGLAITVVPEPGTALLMGLGLLGLASTGRTARRN